MARITSTCSRFSTLVLLATLALTGCGDDDATPSAETTEEPTSEPTTTEPAVPTSEPTTEPSTEPVEPTESVDPGAPADLCAMDVSEVESTMGWSVTNEPAPGFSEGSCNFDFDAAEINVEYFEPPSIETLREQSANFDIEDVEGVGDEAFSYTSPIEITPTNAGFAAAGNGVVLQLGAFSVDEIATEDDLVEGMTVLARLAVEANG